jgi:hypothetical protein
MFNKRFRLVGQAIGLVAVLVLLLAVPGVTQQVPLSRQAVVGALEEALGQTLTATEGDIIDTQCARFYSDARATFSYIPYHPASRSLQRLLEDDFENVPFGVLYLPEDIPDFLKAGAYTFKFADPTRVVLVDQDGNEVFSTSVHTQRREGPPIPYAPCFPMTFTVTNPRIEIKDVCILWCAIYIEEIVIEW